MLFLCSLQSGIELGLGFCGFFVCSYLLFVFFFGFVCLVSSQGNGFQVLQVFVAVILFHFYISFVLPLCTALSSCFIVVSSFIKKSWIKNKVFWASLTVQIKRELNCPTWYSPVRQTNKCVPEMTRLNVNVCVMWWCLALRQCPIMYAYPAFQILDMLCKYCIVFIQHLFCMIWWAVCYKSCLLK